MESAKAVTVALLAFFLLAAFVHASQPALPTSIYGRVVYSNGTPASGILVQASWADNDGLSRTTAAYSLSPSEASSIGNPSYAGYYFFNQGYVQAAAGTLISLSSLLAVNSEVIASAPGGEIQLAKDIVLPDSTDITPPLIYSVRIFSADTMAVSFSTSELAYPAVKYGIGSPSTKEQNRTLATFHIVRMTNLLPYSDYVLEVSATDAAGNSVVDDNNGKYYRFRTGSAVAPDFSQVSGGTGNGTGTGTPSSPTSSPSGGQADSIPSGVSSSPEQNSKQSSQNSIGQGSGSGKDAPFSEFDSSLDPIPDKLPTSIYGRISDSSGKPIEGAEVAAKWSDNDGTHELSTLTLTKEEAERLGNINLAGYYFFRKNLTLQAGTKVNISSPEVRDYEASAISVPAGRTEVSRTEVFGSASAPQKLPENKKRAESPLVEEQSLKPSGFPIGGGFLKGLLAVFSYIIFLAAAVFFILSFRRFVIRMKARLQKSGESELVAVIRRDLLDKRISKIMTRNVASIESSEQLREAVTLMLKKDYGSIIVMQGSRLLGIVSEKSISEDVLLRGMQVNIQLKSATILPVVQLSPRTTVFEAYQRLYNAGERKAAIIENKAVVGIITLGDIAREIREFAGKHSIESETLPDVDSVMDRNYIAVQRSFTLKKVAEAMKRNSSDYAFIDESPFSIITVHDLLGEVYSNGSRAADFTAATAAKPRVQSITPSLNVFEANEAMGKTGFRRLAVSQGKVTGIVTQEELVSSILTYLQQVCEALQKK